MSATCHTCHRELVAGEDAWADDVKVVDLSTGAVRLTTRYTCDDCEVAGRDKRLAPVEIVGRAS